MTTRAFHSLKWLYPGMRVKRWLAVTLVGIFFVVAGLALFTNINGYDFFQLLDTTADYLWWHLHITISESSFYVPVGVTLIVLGLATIFLSFFQVVRSIIGALWPKDVLNTGDLADKIYQRRTLAQGLNIVVIGGGTGLSTLLSGLKRYTSNLTAIVTVSDNGGSSGQLMAATGILPPGDLRNCMVALAEEEPTLARAFNYRFNGQHPEGLRGHSLGNLFIAALVEINSGNYEQAIADASKILAIRGQVYPSTLDKVTLVGELADGEWIEGETEIVKSRRRIERIWLRPENAQPRPEAIRAIAEADAIVLGPGSIYTSIIPNLLVDGIADAIDKSDAVKLYICNVMTEVGETDGFTASDHIRVLLAHAGGKRIIDYVLLNKERPSPELLAKYAKSGQTFVEPDIEGIEALGIEPVLGNFISQTDVLRHNPARLARTISEVIF